MFSTARKITILAFVLALVNGQLVAQQQRGKHRSSRSGVSTQRMARVNSDRISQVQFETRFGQPEVPPRPPQFRMAQNPLDDLEAELNNATDEVSDLFGDNDNPPSNTSNPLDQLLGEDTPPSPEDTGRSLDDILGGDQTNDNTGAGVTPDDEDAASDASLRRRTGARNRGLRDEDYYRGLGAPQGYQRRPRGPQPLTMENIFGDDDEYDQCCEREYCRRMWACAGGRCQNWWTRLQRDLDRSRLLRDSQCNCQQMYRNDFKCPKVQTANANGYGSPCDQGGYYGDGSGYNPEYGQVPGQFDGQMTPYDGPGSYGGTMFDSTEVFGGDQAIPTPADIPEANVDGA